MIVASPVQAEELNLENIPASCTCTCNLNLDYDFSSSGSVDTVQAEDEVLDNMSSALPGDIIISEFVSDPVSNESEWIELMNTTTHDLDLTDWYLEEGAGYRTFLRDVITAKGYLVVDKSSLNNNGDIIMLKDDQGVIMDQVAYGDYDDGTIIDNAPSVSDPNSVIWHEQKYYLTTVPTPGEANVLVPIKVEVVDEPEPELDPIESGGDDQAIIPEEENDDAGFQLNTTQYQLSSNVRINEIFPNPEGADSDYEWIELYNFGGSSLDLYGWVIDDIDGGSQPFIVEESTVVLGGDYIVFGKEMTGLSLNNGADSVRLIDPEGRLIDNINYGNAPEGKSFNYFESGWQWTDQISLSRENVVEEDSFQVSGLVATAEKDINDDGGKYSLVNIFDVKNSAKGDLVEVEGTLVVLPGVFGEKVAYLDGIQIYSSKSEWPELLFGDRLSVRGKVSEYFGEKRILVSSVDDLNVIDNTTLEPLTLNSEELKSGNIGRYIQFQGQVVDKSGTKLTLVDDFGEVVMVLKANTGISSKKLEVGDNISVKGILSQYKEEVRILPRTLDDIIINELEQRQAAGVLAGSQNVPPSSTDNAILIILSVVSVLLLLLVWQRKLMLGYIKRVLLLFKSRANQPII